MRLGTTIALALLLLMIVGAAFVQLVVLADSPPKGRGPADHAPWRVIGGPERKGNSGGGGVEGPQGLQHLHGVGRGGGHDRCRRRCGCGRRRRLGLRGGSGRSGAAACTRGGGGSRSG